MTHGLKQITPENRREEAEEHFPAARLSLLNHLTGDLAQTVTLRWHQVISPAVDAMAYIALALYREWLLPECVALKNDILGSINVQKNSSPLNQSAGMAGLSLESEIALRKIQGSMRSEWSAAVTGRTLYERWGGSSKKVLHSKIMYSTGSRLKNQKPFTQTAVGSISPIKTGNAPMAQEEIRGLDDIYTTPVQGLFLEETLAMSSRKTLNNESGFQNISFKATEIISEPDRLLLPHEPAFANKPSFDESLRRKVQWQKPLMKPATEMVSVADGTEIDLASLASNLQKPLMSHAVGSGNSTLGILGIALQKGWNNAKAGAQNSGSDVPGSQHHALLVAESSGVHLKNDENTHSSLPGHYGHGNFGPGRFGTFSVRLFQWVTGGVKSWFSNLSQKQNSRPITVQKRSFADKAPAGNDVSVRQESASDSMLNKACEPSKVLQAQNNAAAKQNPLQAMNPYIRKPLEKLDENLTEDLSSCDFMVRNNRILSNSISNLVESYFHQAAQESETDY